MFSISVLMKAPLPTNIVADSLRDNVRIRLPLKAFAFISVNLLNLKLYYNYTDMVCAVSKADTPMLYTDVNAILVPVNSQL